MDTESNTVQTPSCHGTKMFMVGFVTHTSAAEVLPKEKK